MVSHIRSFSGLSSFFSASDGLRLHARLYGDPTSRKTPIVCLPGLTRHSHDFEKLASYLAEQGYFILCPDYRGRGLSQWDEEPSHYDIFVESDDLKTALIVHHITQAIFIGTSRGALHILVLAAMAPSYLKAAILNDMGPVLDQAGLRRIKAYGRPFAMPTSWEEATELLKYKFRSLFPDEPEENWIFYTRGTFMEKDGQFSLAHDPRIFEALSRIKDVPDLWPQFAGLSNIPLLVIRGALSDILSQDTLEEMAHRHPNCDTHIVAHQGHAPLLRDTPTIETILRFIEKVTFSNR